MIRIKEVYDFLCGKYPLDTACNFDNPGFLVGDINGQTDSVLVSLDCDINTVKEAVKQNCKLIITHHPVIFNGLKSVTAGSVVYELIKNGVSVISMHTNLDIARGGVTERLCERLGLFDITEFTANDGFLIRSAKSSIHNADDFAVHAKNALGGAVRYVSCGKEVKNVLVCSGSGGEFLSDAAKNGFDALVTADVKHNVFIDAVNAGISVFDCGHFASENVIIKPLADMLSAEFKDVSFLTYSPDYIKSI